MAGDDSSTEYEFSVDMTCGRCEAGVAAALTAAGIPDFKVNLSAQRVTVRTALGAEAAREAVEGTGKVAVLVGSGNLAAAVAELGREGDPAGPGPRGVVRLTQLAGGRCLVEGTVDGLSPGAHGLAIHETGDTSAGCASLGGHYNPRSARHGSPDSAERHAGDLGNITAGLDGRARFRVVQPVLQVWEVIGRSVVVASGRDDLGLGAEPGSGRDGNCGSGVACGVIARSAGLGQNNKKICACDGVTIWDERNKPLTGPGRRES